MPLITHAWRRDNGKAQGEIPGAADLYVQCPKGAANQPAEAWRNPLGHGGAGTWTAASPATTCPTLPGTLLWRRWHTWAVPGGASRRSSKPRRATWGWTSTRPAPRIKVRARLWDGLASSHCSVHLLAGAFLLIPATGLGGKRCPGSAGRRCSVWCARCCPGSGCGAEELLRLLEAGAVAQPSGGQPLSRQTPRRPPGVSEHSSRGTVVVILDQAKETHTLTWPLARSPYVGLP